MYVTHLSCSACAAYHAPNQLHNLCTQCGKPLLVHYDLERAAATLKKDSLPARPASLWRYREVLPVVQADNIVSLGEGWTPLLHAQRLGEQLGLPRLHIKDESCNPTGSQPLHTDSVAFRLRKRAAWPWPSQWPKNSG